MKKKITFVCTGNTCRSPMAEALFRSIIEKRGLEEEFSVSSAGVYAYEGDPASYEAIAVMKEEYGLDLASHRAKVLEHKDIQEAYLILTMTRHHRDMILEVYPEAADKVFPIKEFVRDEKGADVCDPYGKGYEDYKDCAGEIESLLNKVLDKI